MRNCLEATIECIPLLSQIKRSKKLFSAPNDEKKTVVESVKEEKECARISRKKLVLYSSLQVATFRIKSRTDGVHLKNGWRLEGDCGGQMENG